MAYLWNIIVALSVILPLLGVADTHLPLLGAGSVVRRSVVVESLVDVDRLKLRPGDVIHLTVNRGQGRSSEVRKDQVRSRKIK
jgi:hypothetical protein